MLNGLQSLKFHALHVCNNAVYHEMVIDPANKYTIIYMVKKQNEHKRPKLTHVFYDFFFYDYFQIILLYSTYIYINSNIYIYH